MNPEVPQTVYVNGTFFTPDQAPAAALDRGLLLGDGLFESLRTYRRRPFLLQRHIQRMLASAGFLNIPVPLSPPAMSDVVDQLIEGIPEGELYIRITLTRGISTGGLAMSSDTKPTLIIFAKPYKPLDDERYRRGYTVTTALLRRMPGEVLPRHKTTSYLPYMVARREAIDTGADEAVFVDVDDCLCEGTTTNCFVVLGDCVVTPPREAPILPGVTRQCVIELCREMGIDIQQRPIDLRRLASADEMFLTNSLLGVMAVRQWLGLKQFEETTRGLTRLIGEAYTNQAMGNRP